MRELDLLGQYLLRLRQQCLQNAHQLALDDQPSLLWIQTYARQAELCERMHAAVKVLAQDPGKFIQEFLP